MREPGGALRGAQLAQGERRGECGDGRLPALVLGRAGQPGAVARLLLGVAGQHAVAHRLAGVEGDPGEPGGDRVADVLEVRGAAADDHPERDDGVVPLGQRLGDDRQLHRPRRPDDGRARAPRWPCAASTARASSASVISACQVVATMPRVRPAASTGRDLRRSGAAHAAARRRAAASRRDVGRAGLGLRLDDVEQVTHPVALGAQVAEVLGRHVAGQRHPAGDLQAVALEPGALGRVVGQQPHRVHAEVDQDLRAGAVVAGVGGQAEVEVGVDGVGSGVLELVGLQLVQQADAPALVPADVEHDAAPLLGDGGQRGLQLGAAVAAQRPEDVAGEALGVHADQHVLAVADLAVDEGDVLALVVGAAVADRGERARHQRDDGLGDPLDQLVEALAVGDQVGDRDHAEVVLVGEDAQLLAAGHAGRVLLADDLAERPRGAQPGQHGEVDGGLGVAGAAQHPAVLGPQRHDVPGAGQVGRGRPGVGEQPDGVGPVDGGDAGRDALARVDGDRVGGAAPVLVDPEHRRQVEPVGVLLGHRDADVARGVPDHERHEVGGRQLGGEDQVALVLAVLVVDDDDRPAAP